MNCDKYYLAKTLTTGGCIRCFIPLLIIAMLLGHISGLFSWFYIESMFFFISDSFLWFCQNQAVLQISLVRDLRLWISCVILHKDGLSYLYTTLSHGFGWIVLSKENSQNSHFFSFRDYNILDFPSNFTWRCTCLCS